MKTILITIAMTLAFITGHSQQNSALTETEPAASQKNVNCADFKSGEFRYLEDHTDVKITRTKKYQIEESADRKIKLRIRWTSECTYTLTLVKCNNDKDKENIGKTMYNEIILIDGSKVTVSTKINGSRYTTKMEKIN